MHVPAILWLGSGFKDVDFSALRRKSGTRFTHDNIAHTVLGAYHARTAMAELDESKAHFEKAIALNGGKFLPTKLNFAQRYYCAKGEKAAYEKTLNEVLAAGDDLPEARLQNVIAKRRARRYLGNKVWQEECGFKL